MKGRILSNWGAVDWNNPQHCKAVLGAFQHYCQIPAQADVIQAQLAAMQHFTTTGDFPAAVKNILARFKESKMLDEGWRDIFDVRDFTSTKADGFKIRDVREGIVFNKIEAGDKIVLKKISGDDISVSFLRYGGGLSWDRTWFEDEQWWDLEDSTEAFRNKAFDKRSQVHYDLIEAIAASIDLAWQAVTPAGVANTNENYDAIRDANTINKACETIMLALKDLGLGVGVESEFRLIAPIQLWARIRRAMGVLNAGISANQPGIVYNVVPQFTTRFTTTDKYYVCLPKGKNKSGIRQELTLFGAFDELAYVDRMAGWMRFGAAIGNIAQFSRCAIAA